jgi:hypothetical protein
MIAIRREFVVKVSQEAAWQDLQMPGMKPSPLQTSFFRAGHAHAGVLVILSLICQIFVEHAAMGPGFAWLVRIGVPLAAILIPLGFFFGGVHAGSPEWMDSVVVCWSAGAGD